MKLSVRITRMWEHCNMNSTALYDPNFLTVDHKGNTMEGSIPTNRIRIFENKVLKRGHIYDRKLLSYLKPGEKIQGASVQDQFRSTNSSATRRFTCGSFLIYLMYNHKVPAIKSANYILLLL